MRANRPRPHFGLSILVFAMSVAGFSTHPAQADCTDCDTCGIIDFQPCVPETSCTCKPSGLCSKWNLPFLTGYSVSYDPDPNAVNYCAFLEDVQFCYNRYRCEYIGVSGLGCTYDWECVQNPDEAFLLNEFLDDSWEYCEPLTACTIDT